MRFRLIQIRKMRGKRQWEMAEFLGVARSTYTQYETGRSSPKLDDAVRIKQFLNYKEDDLFFNLNVKKREQSFQ